MNQCVMFICFFFLLNSASGQCHTFEKTLDFNNSTGVKSIVKVDSGFIMGGFERTGSNTYEIMLFQINKCGNLLWKKNYSRGQRQGINKIIKTNNELIILASLEDSTWLLKTDLNGDTIWTKEFSGFHQDFVHVPNNGYFMTGYIRIKPDGHQQRNGLINIRTDAAGNVLWQDTLIWGFNDWGLSVVANPDTTFTILANLVSPGNVRASVLTVDDTGVILWQREYPFVTGYYNRKIIPVKNSTDYVFTGITFNHISLVRITATGDTVWNRTFGGPEQDVSRDLIQTSDGGFAITGFTKNFGNNKLVYFIKTDSLGNLEFERTYGTNAFESGNSIVQTQNDEFFIVGGRSFVGYQVLYLIKTDSQGKVWPVGVEENRGEGLQIKGPFPNPANDQFSVELINAFPTGQYSIQLYDIHGRNVYSKVELATGSRQTIIVPTAGLPNSVFYIKISNGENSVTRKVIVIN